LRSCVSARGAFFTDLSPYNFFVRAGGIMIDQEIINKINKVFEESFEIEKERLVPEAHIFTDLGLDSLDIVDLVVALQNAFGVKIRNEEKIRDIRTLQDLYQFISSLKNEEVKTSS
jgi:acyl carrier protein